MLHRIPIIALALLLTSSLQAETKTAPATQTLGRTADRVKKLKAHLETFYLELNWEPGSQPPCVGHTWRLTTKQLPEYMPRGDEFFLIWEVPGDPTVASGRSTVRISEKLAGGIIDYLAREGFFARAKTAAGQVTLKADKPTTVLLAGTSGHDYLCYEVLNKARAKKLSAFVHRTFAEATVIRDARLAAAREVLVRKAIALRPRNSRADPKNNQNSTGLDFSDVLKWSGQKSFVERFTKAPKPYDDKIDELKSDSYSEQTRVWALCALLNHPDIDVKIRAARVLAAGPYAFADAVPALLAAAKSNDYPVEGSESASIHMFYRSTLKKALEKITREALTPKGLKVITYPQPGKPKTIRSEDNPRYFRERVDFKKVEIWLRDVFLSWSPGVTRELERWGKGRNCYLDLDTGKVYSEPIGLADEKARRAWCTKMGIDLVCDMRNIPDSPGRGLVLVGVDLQAAGGLYRTDTTSERWWDLRASRARALLAKADPLRRPVLRWSSYVFKTREGRVGQLDPFEATDKKLKLRYRLVRPDTAATIRHATQPALPQPVLDDLGKRLAIRVEADSWDTLVKKVKPTFTWCGRDMMWVGRDEKGNPQFTLDRAHVYKPKGKPAKWVLLTSQSAPYDSAWAEFGGNYLPGIAKLHKKEPETDHGSGEYAIVKSTDPKGGTVYEIGWQATMCHGTSLAETERRLFVLRDGKGKWRFVGEGPACTRGKSGGAYCYWNTLRSRVTWTGKSDAPVQIKFTWKHVRSQLTPSDDDPIVPKRDLITYRDAVMEGKLPAKPRWTSERPYILAGKDDTFEGIVQHLASWTTGWDANKGDYRQIMMAMWRKGLDRLNPKLPRGKIPEGAKIQPLTRAETVKYISKHRKAATHPTTTTKPATRPGKPPAANKAIDDLLDRLLADYRAYGLPMPPVNARLALLTQKDVINNKMVQTRYVVWLIEPATAKKGAHVFFLLQAKTRFETFTPIEAKSKSIQGDDVRFLPYNLFEGVCCSEVSDALALSVQVYARGNPELAKTLLKKSQEGVLVSFKGNHRKQLAHMAWGHWCHELGKDHSDRKVILGHLQALHKSPYKFDGREYAILLMDLKKTLIPSAAKAGSVEAIIDAIVNCTSTIPSRDPIYDKLCLRGFEAAPALLKHLDDYRLTRVIVPAFMRAPFYHKRVAHVAGEILQGLSGKRIDTRWAPGRGVTLDRKAIEAWWKQAQKQDEETYLVRNVLFKNRKGEPSLNEHILHIMGARYPKHLPGLYEKVLKDYSKAQSFDLVALLAKSDLPRKDKVRLFLKGARSANSTQRRAALYELLIMKEPQAVPLLIEAIRKIPRTPRGSYWDSDAGYVCALACWADSNDAWQAVAHTARRVDVGQRMEILNNMGNTCWLGNRRLERRLALLEQFLDDAEVRDESSDPEKYNGPNAGFFFPRMAVRDLAAETIAGLLGLKTQLEDLDPSWKEQDWAKFRRQVKKVLSKRKKLSVTRHATKPAGTPTSRPTTTTRATTTSAPAVEPAVMAILKRLEAAGDRYPNITAEIDYKVDMIQTGDTEQRTGKVYYQGPTKKTPAKFRIHFDTLRQGKGPKVKDVVDYAFDGAWLTVRKERIKQMTRYQVAPPGEKVNPIQLGKGPFPVPFGQKAETVIKHFRPSTRPVKKSDPKDTDYLKLVTRRRYRKDFSVVWLEMWVERKRGLPVKIVTEDRSENLTTVVFKKIATPKRFPPKTFNLPRPPIGWEYHVERYKGKIRNSK